MINCPGVVVERKPLTLSQQHLLRVSRYRRQIGRRHIGAGRAVKVWRVRKRAFYSVRTQVDALNSQIGLVATYRYDPSPDAARMPGLFPTAIGVFVAPVVGSIGINVLGLLGALEEVEA